jgi:hypothetical protein
VHQGSRTRLPEEAAKRDGTPIHPPDATVCLDIGSFQLWIAHYTILPLAMPGEQAKERWPSPLCPQARG